MSRSGTSNAGRITRDHLESRFRSIQGEVEEVESEATNFAGLAVVVIAVTLVVVAFSLGSRRGRKRRTVVEIRRS
jgi:H+/gluconate symporter-like permease